MVSKTIEKAKQHPGITMFITLGSIAAASIAILNFTGVIDKAVVSHAEMAEIFAAHSSAAEGIAHPQSQQQIDLIRQESRCSSIDIQIAILSDVIWRLEQSEPDGLRLVEKRADMVKLRSRYDALFCASLLMV